MEAFFELGNVASFVNHFWKNWILKGLDGNAAAQIMFP